MIVPDANLLLYAYNTASPYHAEAKCWWEACLDGTETLGMTYPVLFAFLRVSTSTKAFPTPYSLREASEHIESWLERSATRKLMPGATYVAEVVDLLEAAGSAGGNLVTDAQIGALALQHNATVHTADYDFRRFKRVKSHFPLDER